MINQNVDKDKALNNIKKTILGQELTLEAEIGHTEKTKRLMEGIGPNKK